MTTYYCCDCGDELPEDWVVKYFVDLYDGRLDELASSIQCKKCHKYDEQLNLGGDEE